MIYDITHNRYTESNSGCHAVGSLCEAKSFLRWVHKVMLLSYIINAFEAAVI